MKICLFYRSLWDGENEKDQRINASFGSTMSGLAMRALTVQNKNVLSQSSFGKSPKELDGKAIKKKADDCLLNCKKYYGYWNEFLINGQYPSGKDESDALKFVLTRVYNDGKDHTIEVDNDDEEDNTGEDDEEEDTGGAGEKPEKLPVSDVMMTPPPEHFYPPAFLAFMLMGPWGKAHYDLDMCPLLVAEASEYDNLKDGARQNMRKAESKVHDLSREGETGRGLTTLQVAEMNHKNRTLQIDEDIMKQQGRVQKDMTRKNRFEMYEKLIALGSHKIGQSRYDSCVEKMFDLVDKIDYDSDNDTRPKEKKSRSSSSSSSSQSSSTPLPWDGDESVKE